MDEPKVTDLHPLVAERTWQWQRIADVLAGQDALKCSERRTDYVPRLPGHDMPATPRPGALDVDDYPGLTRAPNTGTDAYDGYVRRAHPLTSRAQRAINGMVGMATRRDAEISVPQTVEPWLRNLTLDGCDVNDLVRAMVRESLAYSWGALVVNYDTVLDRPYVRMFDHGTVTNWARVQVGGRMVPAQVVIREEYRERARFGVKSGVQYRVLELVDADVPVSEEYPLGAVCTAQVWREVDNEQGEFAPFEDPQIPLRGDKPIGQLPVVPFTAHNAALWTPGKPPMLELVDLILSHFRNSADYENLVHFAGAGNVLFVSGVPSETVVRVGGDAAVIGEAVGSDCKWVLTGGQGGEEIRKAMADKVDEMGVAIARLLLSQDKRFAETAESQRIAFAGDDATLGDVVNSAESAVDEALAWMTWWGRAADTLEEARDLTKTRLNRDFLAEKMSVDDLAALGLEVDARRLSSRTYYALAQRGGIARPGVTFEEEQAEIGAQADPAPFDENDPATMV